MKWVIRKILPADLQVGMLIVRFVENDLIIDYYNETVIRAHSLPDLRSVEVIGVVENVKPEGLKVGINPPIQAHTDYSLYNQNLCFLDNEDVYILECQEE